LQINVQGKYLLAKFPLTSENMRLFTNLPGFRKWVGRHVAFSPTGANIEYVKKHWPSADWDNDAQVFLNQYSDVVKSATDTRSFTTPDTDDFMFKTKPYQHQRKAFYLSRNKDNFGLFMEQGTGKTKVAIDTAAYLYSKSRINCLVIIAPNGVHNQWLDKQLPDHMPDWCIHESIHYYSGMNKNHETKFNALIAKKEILKVFAFNIESFVSKKSKDYLEKILLSHETLLVVDESSRIKTPGANRTKVVTKLGKLAKYKRILTGTPVTKGVEDLYAQFTFLDPYILGYDSFYTFKANYCITREHEGRRWIVGYRNTDELIHSIKGHSFRVLKSECLDLPPKIYQRHKYELSKEQKRLYTSLKEQFVAELNGEEVSVPETITRMLRLQQVICNWFPYDKELKPIEENNPRLKALSDVLSVIDQKTIIWCRFRADIMAIHNMLKGSCVLYYGDIPNDQRATNIKLFQENPQIKYFVGHAQAGGLGLNLTAAQYAVYYSNSFDLEMRLQSEDRCHRIGTTSNVTYIDLEANNTLDTYIIKALRKKKSLADMVNEDPKCSFLGGDNE